MSREAGVNIRAKRSGTRKFLPGDAPPSARGARRVATGRVAHRLLAPEAARRGSLFRKKE
jgi:hypothetical protein